MASASTAWPRCTRRFKRNRTEPFYKLYPEKFNNKTNGITFRRWLLHSNPRLTAYIENLIGDGFKENADCLKALNDSRF